MTFLRGIYFSSTSTVAFTSSGCSTFNALSTEVTFSKVSSNLNPLRVFFFLWSRMKKFVILFLRNSKKTNKLPHLLHFCHSTHLQEKKPVKSHHDENIFFNSNLQSFFL